MDRLVCEMERRFDDETAVPLLKSISVCHPDSKQFLDTDILQPLIEAYKLDQTGSLSSQIDVCKLMLKQCPKPEDIAQLITLLNPASGFPDLRRLLQLALTVPIANVAAERSFSSMRNIRTYTRSTMAEQRLSTIALLNIENELAKKIDLDKMVDVFARLPSLRDTCGGLADTNSRRLEL